MLFHLFGVPIGVTVLLLNAVLMLVGARVFGRAYFLLTVYAFVATSILIELIAYLMPETAWTNEPILNVLYGSVLLGMGFAACFKAGAASGGLSLAAHVIADRFKVGVGRIIQIIDGGIVVISGIVFNNIEAALWAGVGVYIAGFIVDKAMSQQHGEPVRAG